MKYQVIGAYEHAELGPEATVKIGNNEYTGPVAKSFTLFLPAGIKPPKTLRSFSHGKPIPTDVTGFIEIPDDQPQPDPRLIGTPEKYQELQARQARGEKVHVPFVLIQVKKSKVEGRKSKAKAA